MRGGGVGVGCEDGGEGRDARGGAGEDIVEILWC